MIWDTSYFRSKLNNVKLLFYLELTFNYDRLIDSIF